MNAKELIRHLNLLSPETKVVIRGYEDGFNDISQIKTLKIIFKPENMWYYGAYEKSNDTEAIDAVELFGENSNKKI
jgi:hypothetical protein